MVLIETELTEVVIWNLAEGLPRALKQMYKNSPQDLLENVEQKIQSALSWKETILKNGGHQDEVEEIFYDLLQPNYRPNEQEQPDKPITERIVVKILKDLIKLKKANRD
jgi:hypothetical protein